MTGQPAGHLGHGQRADQRHGIHLHRARQRTPWARAPRPRRRTRSLPHRPAARHARSGRRPRSPNTPDQGDPNSIEIGTKFKADVNGQVKAIRFYKAVDEHRDAHRQPLDLVGTKLASVTFSSETTSGWQQANLASPVTITAGTVYVVSYFAPGGHYAADTGYFAASGVDSAASARPRGWGQRWRWRLQVRHRRACSPPPPSSPRATTSTSSFSTVPVSAPAAPANVDGYGGERHGDGQLDGTGGRWERRHELHGDAVHRHDRPDADHGDAAARRRPWRRSPG